MGITHKDVLSEHIEERRISMLSIDALSFQNDSLSRFSVAVYRRRKEENPKPRVSGLQQIQSANDMIP